MPKNKPESDEKDFQSEIRKTGWFKEYVKEYGEEPDLNTSDYDYRSAWKAGVRPVRDPYDKNRYHWSSSNPETGEMLKSKDHPTAWKEEYMKSTGKNPDEVGVTKEQYMKQAKPKMAMGGSVESPVSVPVQPPADQGTLVIPKFGMAKGGKVAKQTQRMLKEGGMMQEGGTVDPVSGNDVPTGAMQEEVRDDIPAQLSEGEFVFPADVVRFIGLERLMMMRQAAKEGLGKMEAMGQMSNADEATEEDDGAFESQIDEIMGEMGDEEVKMQAGGMVAQPMAAPTAPMPMAPPMAAPMEPAVAQTQDALAQDQQPMMPTEEKSASAIIAEDIRREGYTPEQTEELNATLNRVAGAKAVVLKEKNTVLVGSAEEPGVLTMKMFSTDTPEDTRLAVGAMIKTLQTANIKGIKGETKNEDILAEFEALGYTPQITEVDGMYQYSVDMKPVETVQ
jgi:hypothetical protein